MIQIKSMKGHQQHVIRKDNVTYTIQKEQDNKGNFQNTVSIQNMQSQGANRMRVLHSTTPDLTSSFIREVNLQQFQARHGLSGQKAQIEPMKEDFEFGDKQQFFSYSKQNTAEKPQLCYDGMPAAQWRKQSTAKASSHLHSVHHLQNSKRNQTAENYVPDSQLQHKHHPNEPGQGEL